MRNSWMCSRQRRSTRRRRSSIALTATLLLACVPALAQSEIERIAVVSGSGRDIVFDTATDTNGNKYLVGETNSPDFPVVGGVQSQLRGTDDAFIVKLDPNDELVWSTYFGGGGFDSGRSIAVDDMGNVYVTGFTSSSNLTLQNPRDGVLSGTSDAFILKLNAAGNALLYSSYFGGSSDDSGEAIAVDDANNIYVAGRTRGGLATVNAFQSSFGGVEDAFVLKLNADFGAYGYVTYLGGDAIDVATAIGLDDTARACIAGFSSSSNFPDVNPAQPDPGGAQDGFYSVIGAGGDTLVVSSLIGGSSVDRARGVACSANTIAAVGDTLSPTFPTGTGSPAVQSPNAGGADAWFAEFSLPNGSRENATLFGGRRDDTLVDILLEAPGSRRVFGNSSSSDLPGPGGAPLDLTGTGVLVSTDGGATWGPTGLQGVVINGQAVAPGTPRRILVGTDRGLKVSTNNGATFVADPHPLASRVVHDVEVEPAAPCTWRIGIDSRTADGATPIGGAITLDCGVTWNPWGFTSLRIKRIERLNATPARYAIAVDRINTAGSGTARDTCVVDADGNLVRCLGRGTSDSVLAADLSETCRFFEGSPFGEVRRISGNDFGCDHPFSDQTTSAPFGGSAVTAMDVFDLPDPQTSVLAAGTANGRIHFLNDPGGWSLPESCDNDIGIDAVAFLRPEAEALVACGQKIRLCPADGSGCSALAADTGAAEFGGLVSGESTSEVFGMTELTGDVIVGSVIEGDVVAATSGGVCREETAAGAAGPFNLLAGVTTSENCELKFAAIRTEYGESTAKQNATLYQYGDPDRLLSDGFEGPAQ